MLYRHITSIRDVYTPIYAALGGIETIRWYRDIKATKSFVYRYIRNIVMYKP